MVAPLIAMSRQGDIRLCCWRCVLVLEGSDMVMHTCNTMGVFLVLSYMLISLQGCRKQ